MRQQACPSHAWLLTWIAQVYGLAGSAFLCAYRAVLLRRRLFTALALVLGAVGLFVYAVPSERAVIGPIICCCHLSDDKLVSESAR